MMASILLSDSIAPENYFRIASGRHTSRELNGVWVPGAVTRNRTALQFSSVVKRMYKHLGYFPKSPTNLLSRITDIHVMFRNPTSSFA